MIVFPSPFGRFFSDPSCYSFCEYDSNRGDFSGGAPEEVHR